MCVIDDIQGLTKKFKNQYKIYRESIIENHGGDI